jgi:hypothetical protein
MFSDRSPQFLFGLVRVSAPLQILSLFPAERRFETKRSTRGSESSLAPTRKTDRDTVSKEVNPTTARHSKSSPLNLRQSPHRRDDRILQGNRFRVEIADRTYISKHISCLDKVSNEWWRWTVLYYPDLSFIA